MRHGHHEDREPPDDVKSRGSEQPCEESFNPIFPFVMQDGNQVARDKDREREAEGKGSRGQGERVSQRRYGLEDPEAARAKDEGKPERSCYKSEGQLRS